MSKKYTELMDSIKLSPQAKERITENILSADIPRQNGRKNFIPFKKYISVAACFIIVLTGILLVPVIKNNGLKKEPPTGDYIGAPQSFTALAELENTAGFEINDIYRYLPFTAEKTLYTYYSDMKIIEISYQGQGDSAIYRKSPGNEENSGDYNAYKDILTVNVSDISVEIKGNGNLYNLALWEKDGYSYSLNLQNAIDKNEYISILEKIVY